MPQGRQCITLDWCRQQIQRRRHGTCLTRINEIRPRFSAANPLAKMFDIGSVVGHGWGLTNRECIIVQQPQPRHNLDLLKDELQTLGSPSPAKNYFFLSLFRPGGL